MFRERFGTRWRTGAFGMSGDTTGNVRWRLLHGELPAAKQPAAAVLLAGTNDLRDSKVLAVDFSAASKRDPAAASRAVREAAPAIADR